MKLLVRHAQHADAAAVAALLPDLGYSATAEEVARRLEHLWQWPDQVIWVAERAGVLLGLCHLQGVPLLASDGYAEVQALVVAQAAQRSGVGTALLRQAREWAREKGYARLRLRSGVHREEAHRFYEAVGFTRLRASYAFECREA
ncbi:GNAT family N-acetyltransferase [Chitinimonas lacunae]|uniref:GNAT family N-acetyltransferase n=1 Tax=Chitinimonas lacunae TaxID=1963018 RepID=A0ABV8MVU6_9NEIS